MTFSGVVIALLVAVGAFQMWLLKLNRETVLELEALNREYRAVIVRKRDELANLKDQLQSQKGRIESAMRGNTWE